MKPNPVLSRDDHRFVSTEKAAEYLDVSVTSIRRYLASGKIKGYRLGGRLVRVDLNELDAMLAAALLAAGDHDAR